jgi:hypothetical protein
MLTVSPYMYASRYLLLATHNHSEYPAGLLSRTSEHTNSSLKCLLSRRLFLGRLIGHNAFAYSTMLSTLVARIEFHKSHQSRRSHEAYSFLSRVVCT